MVVGQDARTTQLLESLKARGGVSWIRGRSDAAARLGFRRLEDVQHYLPQVPSVPGSLPEDLFEIFETCRQRLPKGTGAPSVWEVWNEPDFYFVSNNAADMAAVLKAAWLGIKQGQPEATVLMPSLAFCPSRYALELAHNGLASWTDGWNVHFYGWAADYPDFLAQHRGFMGVLGLRAPLWVTEIGYLQLPLSQSNDRDALERQAAFHERVLIESFVAGVDRHVVFALDACNYASSDLGLAGSDGRPRPALRMLTDLPSMLRGVQPIWRLVHNDSGASVGVVLEQEDGRWWTVLWAPGRLRETWMAQPETPTSVPERLRVNVRWPSGFQEIGMGFDGGVAAAPSQLPFVELTPERNVHFRTPPSRFRLSGCRWDRIEAPKASRDDLGKLRVNRGVRSELRHSLPPRRRPSPVVVRWSAGTGWRPDKPSQSYRMAPEHDAQGVVEIFNFGAEAAQGRWDMDVPTGWRCWQEMELEGLPNEVTTPTPFRGGALEIPPLSKRRLAMRIESSRRWTTEPVRMTVRWRGDDGEQDQASVRWQVERQDLTSWHRFGWREFQAHGSQPDAWHVFEMEPGNFSLEIRRHFGPQRGAFVTWELPRGTRSLDRFRATVSSRSGAGAGKTYAQLFLVTPDGEVWRYDEWVALSTDGVHWDAGLEDFAPTAWSRHRTMIRPPVETARWLVMRFQGLESGQVIQVSEPALCRPARGK
jgi:hypothetical protein